MKKLNSLLYVVLLLTSMTACDVPGLLQVKNRTGEKITYITYYNSSDIEAEKIAFEIEDGETKGTIFGFGQFWSEEGIQKYLSDIEKIKIITSTDTLVFDDKQQLFHYFKKRRSGIFGQIVTIKVKKVNPQIFER